MIPIIIEKGENPAFVRRCISAINRNDVGSLNIIEQGKEKIQAKTIVLCGSKIITKYLGAGVSGRNAAIKVKDTWYFTLPSPSALRVGELLVRAATQLVRVLDAEANPDFKIGSVPFYVLQNIDQLRQLKEKCAESPYLAFDFETNNSLQPRHPDFKGTMLGICIVPNFSWIVPQWMLYDDACRVVLQDIMQLPNTTKIAHNLSFDIKILTHLNIKPKGRFGCTKILSQLFNENYSNGLKENVDMFLPDFSGYDHNMDYLADVETIYPYLAIDCHATLYLFAMFMQNICEDPQLYTAYRNLYMPACMVLKDMELDGCHVDKKYLDDMAVKVQSYIDKKEAEIQAMPEVIGFVINKNKKEVAHAIKELEDKIADRKTRVKNPATDAHINNWLRKVDQYKTGELSIIDSCDLASPKVLGELLYSDIGFKFPMPVRDGENSGSTDKEALNDIDHPIGQKMRALRTLEKMLGTYYIGISEKIINGKIYAGFNQTGVVTGRISSSNPNLQNIPTRVSVDDAEVVEAIKGIKKAFTAPDGYVVMQADLSQAELRVIAHLSEDANMINAYREGKDLHAITGARIAKMENDFEGFLSSPIFKQNRTIAKSANFGLVYKISPDGYIAYIKQMTGDKITPADEKVHRAAVFGAYPNLTNWHRNYEEYVRTHGFVRQCSV